MREKQKRDKHMKHIASQKSKNLSGKEKCIIIHDGPIYTQRCDLPTYGKVTII